MAYIKPKNQQGFTYLIMLGTVITLSVFAGVVSKNLSMTVQRDKERELLFRGDQYYQAIRSYYRSEGRNEYPQSLDDLTQDPRFLTRRHIRVLYGDPFSGEEESEWTLIHAPNGRIMGVASRSTKEPIQQNNFSQKNFSFIQATSYTEWRFVYLGELQQKKSTENNSLPR